MNAVKLDRRGKTIYVPIGSGTGNVAFTDPLTNGSYSLRITNGGASTETFGLDVNGSDLQNPRPDVSVGTTPSATVGANVYDPTVQSQFQETNQAKPRDYWFLLGNDGPIPDSMIVYATIGGRNDLFKTTYKVGIKNITASLLTGKYRTPVLSSSDTPVSLFARISPNGARTEIKDKRTVNGKLKTVYGTETFLGTVKMAPVSDITIEDTARMRLDTLAN
jgi:hypothetical protein